MSATYSGGWVFGERASMTLGAFKFDDWHRRWEGNLHFPAGTCRVYLEVNPKAGIVKDAPTLFIKTVQGSVVIGVLMRVQNTGRELFFGRINTATALAIEGNVSPDKRRFVLYATHRDIKPTGRKHIVSLYLAPYPTGETWQPNHRRKAAEASKA